MSSSKESRKSGVICYDHIRFWVSNPKLTALSYCVLFGFEPYAYRGPETGFPERALYAVRQNNIVFVFETAVYPRLEHFYDKLAQHGDSVRDVTFCVENVELLADGAEAAGVKIVNDLQREIDDYGCVKYASIQTFGDTIHTLCEKDSFSGRYWPGFQPHTFFGETVLPTLPTVGLDSIDYCTIGVSATQADEIERWYKNVLNFHRFWSVDHAQVYSENSALRATVLANEGESVKILFNAPVNGKNVASQIQEFVDYNGGPGVQRIALRTADILGAVRALRARGVQFLDIPADYYAKLRERVKRKEHKTLAEDLDLDELEKQKILIDFDENGGYVMQAFTKLLEDRPTLFLEIIQRHNHEGFGVSNLKALYAALEVEQERRGNLYYSVAHAPHFAYKQIHANSEKI